MNVALRKTRAERRGSRRHPIESEVGVAVTSGLRGFFARRPRFGGSMLDATVNGMQVRIGRRLAVSTAVKVWVDVQVAGETETLELRGVVCWCVPAEPEGSFRAGISLHDDPRDMMRKWTRSMLEEVVPHALYG